MQERLISLVAGHLLDANSEERLAATSPEYRANVSQSLGDAIALLPKLATGVDVNVRFHNVHAFEYTDEVAIFPLLDLDLLHGWLVDPQAGRPACWGAYVADLHRARRPATTTCTLHLILSMNCTLACNACKTLSRATRTCGHQADR